MNLDNVKEEAGGCFRDWAGLLANQNWNIRENRFAWPSYTPAIFPEITQEVVNILATNRQYSFQLWDGSLVQLVYQFGRRGHELQRATLAFYQNAGVGLIPEDEDVDNDIDEELLSPPLWLRVDYSPNLDSHTLHPECHLHLGGFPNTRIALMGVPGPRQFMETLMAWFYPTEYSDLRYKVTHPERSRRLIEINRMSMPLEEINCSKGILFIDLPNSIRRVTS
jgi:hypothetical protein